MKSNRTGNLFFQFCNALTFLVATGTAGSIIIYMAKKPFRETINPAGLFVFLLYLAYAGYVMWNTRPWLHYASATRSFDLLCYWVLGIVVLFCGWCIILATLGGLGT